MFSRTLFIMAALFLTAVLASAQTDKPVSPEETEELTRQETREFFDRILESIPQETRDRFDAQRDRETQEWMDRCEAFLEEHPDNGSLRHFVDALATYDVDAYHALDRNQLDDIFQRGWHDDHGEIKDFMDTYQDALRSAFEAARADDIAFPPRETFLTPTFDPVTVQTLMLSLALSAKRTEAEGDPDAAAGILALTARFASHLIDDESSSIVQHLMGLAGLRIATGQLQTLLSDRSLDEETLDLIRSELVRIEEQQASPADTLRCERDLYLGFCLRMADGAQNALDALPQEDRAHWTERIQMRLTSGRRLGTPLSTLIPDMDEPGSPFEGTRSSERGYIAVILMSREEFIADTMARWEPVIQYAAQPRWERDPEFMIAPHPDSDELWPGWAEEHPLGPWDVSHNFLIRPDIALTHIRLCETLCDLQLGDSSVTRIDPMSGDPIRVSDEMVWSVGPDGIDQGGEVIYDPICGRLSEGDIVVDR